MFKRMVPKQSNAVAGVIEALLLVALVAVIISTIQLVYIPEIMKQQEADHMHEVENQFSHLKSIIDLQSSIKGRDPISSSITLGSRELPYFITARAFGRLYVFDDDNNYVEFFNNTNDIVLNVSLNAIIFESINAYYINQNFILEGGGVILFQDDGGESMKIHPQVTFINSSGTIYLNWTIYNFSVIGGKDSADGYKSCYIRTQFASNETRSYENISYIRIYSNYVDAWNQSIDWLKVDAIHTNTDYSFVNISKNGSEILSVDIEIVDIEVQIGVGTIMQYPKKT
ncbi:MAG: hypothetical protein QCI00_04345 [Candidatus Thermoplasmatota archaeon]|nr:hypothetical protein [Candidatus Thermoplasmatota archaeon]